MSKLLQLYDEYSGQKCYNYTWTAAQYRPRLAQLQRPLLLLLMLILLLQMLMLLLLMLMLLFLLLLLLTTTTTRRLSQSYPALQNPYQNRVSSSVSMCRRSLQTLNFRAHFKLLLLGSETEPNSGIVIAAAAAAPA
jgi:hypothetical protein